MQAAEIGDQTRAAQILEKHPSVIAKLPSNAARRIVGAAVRNNAAAVEMLLELRVASSAALDNNQTALHYAAWHGNLTMVRTLIAHQAPINIFESEHGGSPLAWALHGSLHSWEREKEGFMKRSRENYWPPALTFPNLIVRSKPLKVFLRSFRVQSNNAQPSGALRKQSGESPQVTRIILYVKDLPKVAAFYQRHFGMKPLPSEGPGCWNWRVVQVAARLRSIKRHQLKRAERR